MTERTAPDWLHVDGPEAVRWERRPHPVALGRLAALGAVLAVIGVGIAWWGGDLWGPLVGIGTVVALLGGILVGYRYLQWVNTRYVITNEELYRKEGIVSRDVTQFRLERVQNTTLSQTAVGRLLGYGTVTVYTAGSGEPELTFDTVGSPHRANAVLTEQLGASDA